MQRILKATHLYQGVEPRYFNSIGQFIDYINEDQRIPQGCNPYREKDNTLEEWIEFFADTQDVNGWRISPKIVMEVD